MCKESSKAMRRRMCETEEGKFDWKRIFNGEGIDVGAGDDPVILHGCRQFDVPDGDANHLSLYVEKQSLNYVHASQCLEHMHNPTAALLDWASCVKKGGHVIVTVPDWILYEKYQWPSRWNPDHKTAWSSFLKADRRCPNLIYIPRFIEVMSPVLECVISRFVDTNYDYTAPDTVDQTFHPDGCEVFHEMVFKKK